MLDDVLEGAALSEAARGRSFSVMLAAPHTANKTVDHLKVASPYNLCGKSIYSSLKQRLCPAQKSLSIKSSNA
jgi:hypothetical protein